ncbi:MAG: LuxR C-terminal-related transcriptional regulator [Nocardioidaceae bacterium]
MATDEPNALVETKLLPPRQRRSTVHRRRLLDRLRAGVDARLLLVAAPAGFGKTTLLSSWLVEDAGRPVAWVSLDERDADPARFWAYVLESVERALPGVASAALAQLRSGRPVEPVLASLVNELSVQPQDLVLVLDDYHLAEGPDLQPGMAFLVEHLPPQVRLVLSTRADPALPLARLRARGELVEVRAADLRFTEPEAGELLTDLGLALSTEDLAALDARTEGWAAALQLAALSLQGRADPSAFIAGFAGDDRFVVDYLASEVLQRQPPDIRRFLLDTSVLGRLTGPLCDAVSGRADGTALLELLERRNLFVVPLDDRRRWFRYHHLFADVLRAHLVADRPGDPPELHRRASAWFAAAGEPEPAVDHALAADDLDRAAELVELAVPDLRRQRREDVIRRWARELPPEAVADRPVLAVELIGGLSASNDFAGLDQRLRDVEAALARPDEELVVVDRAEHARLPALIATYRSALALVDGDLPATVAAARSALELAAEDDHLSIASASALCGLAAWPAGDLEGAHRSYVLAAEHLAAAGHVADVLGCCITIADLEMTFGRLSEADATLRRALDLAAAAGEGQPVRGAADMHVGLARVAWERGDSEAAAAQLDRAAELGDGAGLPQNPYRWRVGMAALRAAQGARDVALSLLEEAERVHVGDFSPPVRPVAATRARLLAAGGDLDPARRWWESSGLDVDDPPTYLREYELVTVARIQLAAHAAGSGTALPSATRLLDRLLAAADAGGRVATAIEVLVLQTLARESAGRTSEALDALDRALSLAEPEGWVRVFTDEHASLRGLLRSAAGRGRSFVGRLQAATDTGAPTSLPTPLVDSLSERELDVLRLLASELDGPDIARRLGVSLSTVRTHTQHVYAKLGVNSRRGAVRRAHQLNLFASGH